MAEHQRIKQVEIRFGSKIYLRVFDVEPSETTWYCNGTPVTITYDSYFKTYIKRNPAKFSDSGLYECKVNNKTINAFNVIVYDLYQCDIGSIIDLRVEMNSANPEWTFNSNTVTSEGDPHIGFEKSNAALEDSGKYECKVDDTVKCVFFVLVYDFDVGMFPRESTGTDDREMTTEMLKKPYESFGRETMFVMHKNEVKEVLKRFYKETNQEVSIYFNKKETYDRGKTCYLYDVIHHEYYECKVGSRLHLRYGKGSVSSTWTLNKVDALSECDPKKGFEKKKADIKDSGTYECRVNGRVMRIIDVIVYRTYEVKFGQIIHHEIEEILKRPEWSFNGFYVLSECDPHKGFKKTNADFTDSGKYKCRVGKKVSNVFQVIVYGYLLDDEFFGYPISVPDEDVGKKPEFLSQQFQTCSYEKISKEDLEKNKTAYKDLFTKMEVIVKVDPVTLDPLKVDPVTLDPLKVDPVTLDPLKVDPVTLDPLKGDSDIPDPPEGDPDIPDPPEDEMLIAVPPYMMNRNPRGLAVIISIGEFDDANIQNLNLMTRADADYCVDTFRHFNFLIRESIDNTRTGILQFLRAIANEDHSNCDGLVLYVSSHGANGFFCCKDYNHLNRTGYITNKEMLSMFVLVPSLAGKPKLVFIDSCRHELVNNLENQVHVPIEIINRRDLQRDYAHILIGYATIVGAAAIGDMNGSYYTKQLTRCIKALAATLSILDVMEVVIQSMQEVYALRTECKFSLIRPLVMSLPAPVPAPAPIP